MAFAYSASLFGSCPLFAFFQNVRCSAASRPFDAGSGMTAMSHLTPFEATSLVPTLKIDEKAFALVMQACLAP